jgi:hypothetical protein
MSKKDKSKFRRRLKAEILKEMQKSPVERPTQPVTPPPTAKPIVSETIEPMKNPSPGIGLTVTSSSDMVQLVRADLKKSAIIIGSIIILIIVLYFVDLKTGILLKASNQIFKVLGIGV